MDQSALGQNPPTQQIPKLAKAEVAPGSQCQTTGFRGLASCLRPTEEGRRGLKDCSPCLAHLTRPLNVGVSQLQPAVASLSLFLAFSVFSSELFEFI